MAHKDLHFICFVLFRSRNGWHSVENLSVDAMVVQRPNIHDQVEASRNLFCVDDNQSSPTILRPDPQRIQAATFATTGRDHQLESFLQDPLCGVGYKPHT